MIYSPYLSRIYRLNLRKMKGKWTKVMKGLWILLLLFCIGLQTAWPQEIRCVHITDANTGEPIPYVGAYVSENRTAISNFNGDLCIQVQPNDTLRLTCIGYETLRLCAADMPENLSMHLSSCQLREVTVRSLERMMTEISRQTAKAFARAGKARSQYFYRQTSIFPEKQDVVEAFINARSAVNLRDLRFVTGRHGAQSQDGWGASTYRDMNLHHMLELAPMIAKVTFWEGLTTPLDRRRSIKEYQRLYNITVEELTYEGRDIYKIGLARNEELPHTTKIMTGSIYVDKSDFTLLSFDGEVENMRLDVNRSALEGGVTIPLMLNLHIDYTQENGFPEVANLAVKANWENFYIRSILFNMGGKVQGLPKGKMMYYDGNMLSTIERAGYDPTFWENSVVVKRTEEEEAIVKQMTENSESEKVTSDDSLPSLAKLATRARLFGERIPQEKVFVQMDNTCYFLGDTIWFAAFTRRTNSGRPSKISRVLYAELWNHDGFLVERKLIEMREGRGHGFFELPDTLYSGYFELRAYTRWQLNWGETEHPHSRWAEEWFYSKDMARDYFRDYEKLYSRVFPVYDKPKEQGEYNRDMTLRPLRRYFKNDPAPPKLLLSLFPEGGTLVEGLPCRLAFEAATEEGEAKDGEVRLMCNRDVIATARTENRGRGTLLFTPQKGMDYEAVFVSEDGQTASQSVTDILQEGATIRVSRGDGVWTFDVRNRTKQPLGLSVMHQGVQSHFMEIGDGEIKIREKELPAGVNQVTVFDGEGRVWADRLFFITRPDMGRPTLSVLGLKEQYEPFEEIRLGVQSTEKEASAVSISIRDAARSDQTYDTGNIMTEMLLASEIKGFVPQPEWFFEKDDEEHRRALDLLMLTQGWRRFRWQDMAVEGRWEMTHPAEQSQVLEGSIHYYDIDADIPPTSTYMEYLNTVDFASNLNTASDTFAKYRFQEGDEGSGHSRQNDFTDINKIGKDFESQGQRQGRTENRDLGGRHPRNDVHVHAEIVKADAPANATQGIVADITATDGKFRLEMPRYYGAAVFFLTAKDTTLWDKRTSKLWLKKFRQHTWIQVEDDENERIHEDAEFYVRLNFPYPRWVKPYDFYQMQLVQWMACDTAFLKSDDKLLHEITVRRRRRGLSRLDLGYPVCAVDAYEAGNAAMDAGLLTDLYALKAPRTNEPTTQQNTIGFGNTGEIAKAVVRNYIADMGMERRYPMALFWDSIRVAGNDMNSEAFVSPNLQRQWSRLEYLDKIYVYSDFSPRWGLNSRLTQANQPSVEVRLTHYPNWERRLTYRDRRYILPGFAYQEDFYHPDYKRNPPKEGQKDYRRTLYWNPSLRLDENGEAHVTLFNNSRKTQIQVEANGMTGEGAFLFNME